MERSEIAVRWSALLGNDCTETYFSLLDLETFLSSIVQVIS